MMTQLLQNAAYGTAMILAVVVLRRALRGRLLPEARLALWAVCLFRLLTPVAPQSVLSLWRLFASLAPVSQPSSPAYSTLSHLPPPAAGAFVPQIMEPGTSPDLYLKPAPFPWETVLPVVWLIVGGLLAAWYVLSWTRTRRQVACAIPLDRSSGRYGLIPESARLREGVMEGAPLTFGAVKPTVVLSPGLEGAELDCVLAHEGVHVLRRDNLWHYAMALALAVHWWNPAVWVMSRLLRRDIELSCDRAAVRRLGADRRAEYARALVSLSTQAEGPAFCQTFGRKATEERIRSVMKFKKTSIIGAVLTLVLVLAVSVAFASEPKHPDSIEFEGMTFSRDQFSQETLDWLEWYISLPEEDRLCVDYIPPELLEATTHSHESTPVMSITCDDQNNLKDVRIGLSYLRESLDRHVADGTISEAEADRVMALAQGAAMNGTLWCVFQPESGLIYDCELDPEHTSFPVYCKDESGELRRLDPATLVCGFVFPASGEQPAYVDTNGYETFADGVVDSAAGADPAKNGYTPPTYVEDDAEIMDIDDSMFSDYEFIVDGAIRYAMGAEPAARMTLNGYQALLNQLVAEGKLSQKDADHFFAGASQGLAQSEANTLHVTSGGSYAIMGSPLCMLDDCGNNSIHQHDGITYSGWLGAYKTELTLCTDKDCIVPGEHYHGYSNPVRTNPDADDPPIPLCSRDDCHETGEHEHNGTCYSGHTTDYVSSREHHSESHHSDSHHNSHH